MLYAAILRPPAHGAKLKSADTSAAEKVPGARVVRDGDLIAVLHEKPDVAAEALTLVKAEFEPSPSKLDNDNIFAHLKEVAPARPMSSSKSGSLDEGAKLAAKTVERSYFAQYVAHAPSEPHTAVVAIEGDKAEVWASTQSPFRAQQEVARTLGLARAERPRHDALRRRRLRRQERRARRSSRRRAWPSSRASPCRSPGRARRNSSTTPSARPPSTTSARVSTLQNRIVLWDYKNFHAGSRSSQPVYDIPHKRVLSFGGGFGGGGGAPSRPIPSAPAPGAGPAATPTSSPPNPTSTSWPRRPGMDPLSFRLQNLADPRMKKVVGAAADAFGRTFAKAPTGRGYGIAITDYLGTYVATMAEVEVDKATGAVRVLRVVCAQDTGEVINPEGIRMQIEGCITMGLGYCLTEEIRFKNGARPRRELRHLRDAAVLLAAEDRGRPRRQSRSGARRDAASRPSRRWARSWPTPSTTPSACACSRSR